MIAKFQHSWQLFKASIIITLRHRKLLWFPVLTTFLTGLIALFFISAMALPAVLYPTGYHLNQKQHWVALKEHYFPVAPFQPHPHDPSAAAPRSLITLLTGRTAHESGFPWVSLCLLPIYLVSMFLATFFNVAFYSEIIAAMNGRGVSFRRGLGVARNRWPSILAWSLLAGLVGWLIRAIEERLPWVGRILMGFIGMAWSVAAVFAIPVIIQEQPMRNPLKILQQSAMTLKRTWGEGLIGYVGFSAGSWAMFIGTLPALVLGIGLAVLLKSVWLGITAGVFWVLGLVMLAYVSRVAAHVYRCALYIYAAEGVVPEPYSQDLLDMAWKVKRNTEQQ
jgi:hypothetical protein